MATVDEILAMADRDLGQQAFTPAPAAPAPTQLQSLANQPTRAPTDIELGVAQLRAMSPTAQLAADLEGRKLLFQEGLSFGVLPKVGAAATSLKEALYGAPLSEAFSSAVTQQDILKEFTKQKELEKENLILGMTGPELAGGLMSPIGSLYTPTQVAKNAPLATALATRAFNVGKAAGTGGAAAGLQTFLSTPGTIDERLAAAEQSAETGAMFGGGAGAVSQAISQVSPRLQQFGKAARRSAIGARQSDYMKTAGKQNFVPKDEGVYTLTQQGIDNVIEKGYLGDSLDPQMQIDNLTQSMRQLDNELDAKISAIDKSNTQVKTPQFIKLVQAIDRGRDFGGVNRDAYAAKLRTIKNDIAAQRTNRLQYLQDQKKYFGSLYDPTGTSADAKFNRAVYHELQAAVERYVPEAKDVNQELQSLILTKPIIDRRKAEASASANKLFQSLARVTYTTGGLFGAGARLAGAGPLTSALLAAGTRTAASPSGRNVIGQALTGGDLAQAAANIGLRSGQLASRPDIVPISESATEPVPQETETQQPVGLSDADRQRLERLLQLTEPTTPETVQIGKQDISIPQGQGFAPPDLVKAVMTVESAGNPKARSNKGAFGLMQLMPGTAKELGVDPKDPQQNVEGGSRYLAKQLTEFDDVRLALAAYNWGPGALSNAIKKLEAEDRPVTWENLKKYGSVPTETENYVKKVLNIMNA